MDVHKHCYSAIDLTQWRPTPKGDGVSEATLYNWKAKFGEMDVSDAKRLRQLEDENAKLKKLLAEQIWMLWRCVSFYQKDGRARRPARGCRACAGRTGSVRTAGLLDRQRRRKMIRYRSCRPPNTELRVQLREVANARRRFGYRRLFVLLRQHGEPSGRNRIYRLYRRKASVCVSAGLAAARSESGRRSRSRLGRMPAGRWILSMISSPMVAASRS
jgi:putative transposase